MLNPNSVCENPVLNFGGKKKYESIFYFFAPFSNFWLRIPLRRKPQ